MDQRPGKPDGTKMRRGHAGMTLVPGENMAQMVKKDAKHGNWQNSYDDAHEGYHRRAATGLEISMGLPFCVAVDGAVQYK